MDIELKASTELLDKGNRTGFGSRFFLETGFFYKVRKFFFLLPLTIPGIGPIIALTILAEAGDLRRFSHYKKFIKFCGMNLSTQQSGMYRGFSKPSKHGNARLRNVFWLAAVVAIRQTENSFRSKFENYIRKDRTNADLKRKAYFAISVKMARVAHSLIKEGVPYRRYFEEQPS